MQRTRWSDQNAMRAERKLWTRCLEEAVECVTGRRTMGHSRAERQRIRDREMRWFSDRNTAPGSYLWICMVIDCDPGAIRDEMAKRLRENP